MLCSPSPFRTVLLTHLANHPAPASRSELPSPAWRALTVDWADDFDSAKIAHAMVHTRFSAAASSSGASSTAAAAAAGTLSSAGMDVDTGASGARVAAAAHLADLTGHSDAAALPVADPFAGTRAMLAVAEVVLPLGALMANTISGIRHGGGGRGFMMALENQPPTINLFRDYVQKS